MLRLKLKHTLNRMLHTSGYILLLLVLQQTTNAQPTIWHQYEFSTSLQPVVINKITQDPFGRMWLGTTKGLFSFDGIDFTLHAMRDSSSQHITAVYCDSQFVFIGMEDGRLFQRSLKSWKQEFKLIETLEAQIVGIVEDTSHNLWIATYGSGLYVKDGSQLHRITVEDGLPGNDIYTISISPDGTAWLGTDGGLTNCSFTSGKPVIRNYTVHDGLSDEIIRCLVVDNKGLVWMGTQDQGICLFDPAAGMFSIPPFSRHWNLGPVSALAIDNDSRLMIGTQGMGLVSISLHDRFHPVFYNQATGYDNVKVKDIVRDTEGNFWIASANRGLDHFPALFQWIAPSIDGISQSMQAVFYDGHALLWFATLEGLFHAVIDSSGANMATLVRLTAGTQPVITSIYEDHHKNLWIGTFDQGLFLRPAGKKQFIQILHQDGLANDNVLSVTGDMVNVWIATLGGVTRCNIQLDIENKNDLLFHNFSDESGLHSNYLYQVFIDSKGRVWFATDGNGLKVYENGTFRSFEKAGDEVINSVYSITEDHSGSIWFSTPSSGLYQFDGDTILKSGARIGLSDMSIMGITTDANGDIVIIENDAIDILEHKTNQIRRYGGRELFQGISPNLNAFARDRFGNIWVATKKGILKYYSPSPEFAHEAQLEIRQVMVYMQPVDFSKVSRFGYNQNYLTFDFQAFWNSDPSQIRYRYRLLGYDLEWLNTKDDRAVYPELPPGTYTFRIQSTIHHNFDDAQTVDYTFTIDPPFWTTWWFVTALFISGGLLVYLLIKERDRRREREEKLKRERIEFQFENLKSQLNPHFLFNSFNTLATLVEEDQHVALSYIDHLADFYRSLLSYKDIDLIPLKKEFELTNNYIFLLKQRHGERLQVDYDVPDELQQKLIPPLTLQLLIENAVKHNVASEEHPLHVQIFTSDKNRICIKNKLQLKASVVSTGFGLQNIRARCELLGRNDFDINQAGGYFQVCVPLFDD